MSEIIRGPKKPIRLERKFRIGKREQIILRHRNSEWFRRLSFEDKAKINDLYDKAIRNIDLVCKHDARSTITQYDILKGYTVVTHRCLDCHKVLQIDVYKTRG